MRKLTKSALQDALLRELRLDDPVFRLESAGGRISGSVISKSFKGMRDHERQRTIWDALDKAFGSEAVRFVGMLLAYTPEEWDVSASATSNA
jgi:acid stress-induced BolA-like protein IbaG/YrbA